MKTDRGSFRPLRREQLLEEREHDSYKPSRKRNGAARCAECGAVYGNGRWSWQEAAPDAAVVRCPACRRIADGYPAGYVTLDGEFVAAHRTELLNLVRHCEAKERAEHPLERLMAVVIAATAIEITTTGTHLAREIAERLHDAYKGELALSYNRGDALLRARWTR